MDDAESIFQAVYDDDLGAVRTMLAQDAELARCRNADSLPVLQFARFMRRDATFGVLVAAGPQLDIFDAASLDVADRVRECLDRDASLAAAYSADGFTALHLASYYGAPNVVRLLLDRNADPNAVTHNFLENMPIHAAAAGRHIDNCATLLVRGADVNARQHGGFVPLHTPAQHGDRLMTELFLDNGADPRIANDEGKTPADIASSQGNTEITALLRGAAARWDS
jgi:ankyrin repeat protein